MTDQQPYEGGPYEGGPYRRQQPQEPQHPAQAWPGQSWSGPPGGPGQVQGGHQRQGYAQGGYEEQHTQQWQGQTWETHVQPPVPSFDAFDPAHGQQGGFPQGGGPQQAYGQPHQNPPPPQTHHQARHGAYEQPRQGPGQPYQEPQPRHAYAQPQQAHAQWTQPPGHAQPLPPHAQPQQAYGPGPAVAAGHAAAPAPEAGVRTAPGAEAEDGPSYGPATLAGNARVTDAQRARLEGRSPIIDPGMQPALLTALLGLLLGGAAAIGSYALVVPLVVLQAVTAAGWFRLNGMWPARQGIALAFLGALTADVAVLAAGREHAPAAVLGPLGVWVLLALVLQLRSHADPDERMYGLMATVVSTALAVIATGWLGADPDAATVGAVAVAVAILARALPLGTPVAVVVSLLAGAGTGAVVGGLTGFGAKGAVLGAGAAVCALIGHRVAAYDYPSRFVHFTAGVALPLSAAAPVAWVLGRALG